MVSRKKFKGSHNVINLQAPSAPEHMMGEDVNTRVGVYDDDEVNMMGEYYMGSDSDMEDDEELETEEQQQQQQNQQEPFLPNNLTREQEEQIRSGFVYGTDNQFDYQQRAYTLLHQFKTEWPIPSFDLIAEKNPKHTFPYTVKCVTGAQICDSHGERALKNKNKQRYHAFQMHVWNLQQLHQTEYDSDEEGEDAPQHLQQRLPPVFNNERITLHGKHGDPNRVRVCPHNQHIVASLHESGWLTMHDIGHGLEKLENRMMQSKNDSGKLLCELQLPGGGGYGLQFSSLVAGKVAAGDYNGVGHIFDMKPDGTWVNSNVLKGHQSSIEDIQFSPSQESVVATTGCDSTVKIWDLRANPAVAQLSWNAASNGSCDINVFSWSKVQQNRIVTGDDLGSIAVWDMSYIFGEQQKQGPNFRAKPNQHFTFHKKAITSIEWHPVDSSILCASSEDHSVSIWDLGLEHDDELHGVTSQGPTHNQLPPQLFFLHMGMWNVKDTRWHPQLKDVLLSVGENMIHVWKPSNM